jgi:hypothetical protein
MEFGFAPLLQCPISPSPDQLGILEVQAMKHAAIGVALLMLTTSVWAGTLRDNFDDGNMDEWDLSEADPFWEVKDGELVITARAFPVQFFIGETTWGDYTVRVRTRIVKHRATGNIEGPAIPVRRESLMHTYGFGLGTRGGGKIAYAFYVQGNTTPRHYVSEAFQWELDTWYDLKLTAEGEQFWFYVDNRLVIHYTDNVYSKGKVGIASAFNGTTVHFDDFSVTGDDVPDLNLAVSPEVKLATTWGKVKGQ